MSFFSTNIRFLREKLNIKQDAFEQIGIKKGTYSNYENGKTEPNIETLAKISKFLRIDLTALICTDLSEEENFELIKKTNSEEENAHLNAHPNAHLTQKTDKNSKVYGKDNSKVLDENCNLNCSPSCNLSPKTEGLSDKIDIDKTLSRVENVSVRLPDFLDNESPLSIPFYDLPVSAGSLGVLDTETAVATVPAGYVQLPAFRGCEAIFPITGISMEPLVSSGDWIGIKSIENLSRSWDFIQTGVIYLIITHEDRMIKFIDKTDDEDFIICKSPNYNPFKVHKGDILNIYRVKAIARGL